MIYWDDSYLVGVEEIDKQHKDVVELMNVVEYAIDYSVCSAYVLNRLATTLFKHLAYEETLFLSSPFNSCAKHLLSHNQVRTSLLSIILSDLDIPEKSTQAYNLMKAWFINHILGTDRVEFCKDSHQNEVKANLE